MHYSLTEHPCYLAPCLNVSLYFFEKCINPKVRLGLALGLELGLGFIDIFGAFKERRNIGEGLYLNCR